MDSPANDQNPAWSPDGERFVFTSGRSGNNELWLMDDDGSDPAALTSNGAENVNLPGRAWCPGNDRIVFASDVESENDEVFSIASDSTDVQRVTETDALNWEPSWSPDCSQIVFQSDRSGNPSTSRRGEPVEPSGHSLDIWVVDAPCVLFSDLDGDGDVDIADIMLVASIWHTAVGDPDYDPTYDLDNNGEIDIVDIMLVAAHWGETC